MLGSYDLKFSTILNGRPLLSPFQVVGPGTSNHPSFELICSPHSVLYIFLSEAGQLIAGLFHFVQNIESIDYDSCSLASIKSGTKVADNP